jgi:hypothetical protein
VGGCYSGTELSQQDVRFEMFSRLFARVQAEEIPLGEVMTTSLLNVTGLPPYLYQTPNARPAGEGEGALCTEPAGQSAVSMPGDLSGAVCDEQ